MKTKSSNQSDYLPDFGSLSLPSGKANTREACATSSSLLTSKSDGKRKYLHTPEQIAKELRVDAEGNLFWRYPKSGRRMGMPIGSNHQGYLRFGLDDARYLNHVVAFCLYHGRWPTLFIDHINNNRSDNRKDNLREVTHSQNKHNPADNYRNNTSGHTGIKWVKARCKWQVVLNYNKQRIFGGEYHDLATAVAARRQLETDYGIADYAVSNPVNQSATPKL